MLQSDYGAGLTDAEVDLERIKHYASVLGGVNDTFDGVIRGPVSVWEAGATVLGTIRAEPARIGNTWSLTRDEQRTARKHVFSRRQVLRGSTSADFKISRNDGAADIIVEYAPGGDPRRRRNTPRDIRRGKPDAAPGEFDGRERPRPRPQPRDMDGGERIFPARAPQDFG